jgi:hypothetical protein
MRRVSNIIVVICGIVGGCAGYWIGYAAGWSRADWSAHIGGLSDSSLVLTRPLLHFLLSIGMAVLFVCVAALVVTWLPARTVGGVLQNGTPAEATVVRVEKTGEHRQVGGQGGVERQLAVELDVRGEGGPPYRARTTQFFTKSAQLALQPGTGVVVRYDPTKPKRVAIVGPVAK